MCVCVCYRNHLLEIANTTKETLCNKYLPLMLKTAWDSLFAELFVIWVSWNQWVHPCKTLLEISVRYPSVLPHVMPSVLFNKGEQSPMLGTDS